MDIFFTFKRKQEQNGLKEMLHVVFLRWSHSLVSDVTGREGGCSKLVHSVCACVSACVSARARGCVSSSVLMLVSLINISTSLIKERAIKKKLLIIHS